jgi:hypothetical protein
LFLCGASAQSAVLFQDDFESASLAHTENGIKWGDSVRVTFPGDRALGGKYAARFRFPGSTVMSDDAWAELRFDLGSLRKEIWIKYDLFVPTNYYHRQDPSGPNNNKFIMLWSSTYESAWEFGFHTLPSVLSTLTGGSDLMASWKPAGVGNAMQYINMTDLSVHYQSTNWDIPMLNPATDNGKWVTFVMHIKAADIGVKNGVIELWKNGKQLVSKTNVDLYYPDASKNGFQYGYLLGWSNSGYNQDTDFYIDNVIFATTGADVGIGGAPATTAPPSPPVLKVN